ncbi:unnamed protein product [Spirodela intermedia]|uniref:valine--tRNA ligase n=1 Tax=Spirodela intermedia TaxID=51605 RepID=A0A7I8J105_SPIIN|nr:unnamed protein product [Spirodela intermedia]CAA6663652.1 unnamed protein product [Spirodela intermedia]
MDIPDVEDLERKKKKEEKAKEKELKKLKAAQKAEVAKVQAQKTNVPKKNERKSTKRGAEDDNPDDYIDPETPAGEKKKLSRQMAKQYSPSAVEKGWYAWWEKSDFFLADASSSKPPFVIVSSTPPNVTGALHIGHALTAALQDAMIRYYRMSGYNALWVPGMDHAGIATQVVVEKKLMRERSLTRHDVGREQFVAEVWKWKEQYGGTILNQERRLGASLDWSRECFTMDENRSKAVTEAFVRLYREGLIYRDHRLVNWDCTLRTAISDIEVDHKEIKERTLLKVPGYANPVEFGLGEIVVATTRIETMLGDTAIAVHPEDPRYTHLHGKFAVHPFNGRRLPIVLDAILVDPNFGTGAVKITPAHDPNDFDVGTRHNLKFINIFTDDGKINSNGGKEFEGMPRFEARKAITEALKLKGLYRGDQKNDMNLGICSRSDDVVEPMVKPQWFVKCDTLAKEALDAVMNENNKKIEIIPKQYALEWKRWLENIRDWCISRQLWWGHRIPAWYVTLDDDKFKEVGSYDDHWVVGRDEDEALLEANKLFSGKNFKIIQDPDVLDTWFSSGLFPLSVLGWPDNTEDFSTFYPTSVYLHPMIRDAHGRKMSKSLGNVIDPLEVINGISLEGLHKRLEEGNLDPRELTVAKQGQVKDFPSGIPECGADALRFALISYTMQSDKINLDIQRVVGYRQWCNKLWNAIRFAMIKLGDDYWILSVLNKAISKTVSSFEASDFSGAASAVYSWWQSELCDVFIEVIKPYFNSENDFESSRASSRDTLWVCLDNGLRLLHPFMPFVTEELWQRLPQKATNSSDVENNMKVVESAVRSLRSLRSLSDKNERRPAFALCANDEVANIIGTYELEISTLANLSSLKVLRKSDAPPPSGCVVDIVDEELSVYLQLQVTIDVEAEREKLRRRREEVHRQHGALVQKMNSSGYKEKARQQIQDDDVSRLSKLLQELEIIDEAESKLAPPSRSRER